MEQKELIVCGCGCTFGKDSCVQACAKHVRMAPVVMLSAVEAVGVMQSAMEAME